MRSVHAALNHIAIAVVIIGVIIGVGTVVAIVIPVEAVA
jgi:hypothetical protein